MSKTDIYGSCPDGASKGPIKEAMSDLEDSFSNAINGKVNDSRDSEYDPEDGK